MHELGRFIQSLMDKEGMGRPDLVRRSGLSRQHVHQLLTLEQLTRLPAPATIDGLHKAFPHVSREAFVIQAAAAMGIPVDVEALKPDYSQLTNETLLGILKDRLDGGSGDAGNAEAEKNPGRATALGGAPDMLDVRDEAIRLATQGEGLSARKPTSITSLSPKHQQMVKDSMPVEEAAYTGHVRRGSDEWARIKEARVAEKRVGEESQDDGGFDPA